jgi:hypothetical protein
VLSIRFDGVVADDREFSISVEITFFEGISFSRHPVFILFGWLFDQKGMPLPLIFPCGLSQGLLKSINHPFQPFLFHFFRHIILIVPMGMGSLPHGVGKQKCIIISNFINERNCLDK